MPLHVALYLLDRHDAQLDIGKHTLAHIWAHCTISSKHFRFRSAD